MVNKKIVNRKIIKLLILFMFFFFVLLFFSKNVYAEYEAVTQEEFMNTIYKFAVNFEATYGKNDTIYDQTPEASAAAYRGERYTNNNGAVPTGTTYENKFAMDCLGWVNFVIHYSTGLNIPEAASGKYGFVWRPDDEGLSYANGWFEYVTDEPKKGDIILYFTEGDNSHTVIYVGDNKIIDCNYEEGTGISGVKKRDFNPTNGTYMIARITEQGLQRINKRNLVTVYTEPIQNSFEYKGLQQGKFGMKIRDLFMPISLEDILDWYIGIDTYLMRAVIVGWVEIIEVLIDNTMEAVTGIESSLTVEKLLFNKVPVLDVNFFDFSHAGGVEIQGGEDNILYVIRKNIAVWYYVIRNLSIVLLLVTLIYLGIRAALSTIADEKAKYKDLLKSWFVSFVMVFSIHYIMIIVLQLNNAGLDLINKSGMAFYGSEESLYDTVRNGSYALQASVGWESTLFYIILVYLLIRFLWVYFKRYIVVAILTLMAPFIGVLYSLDKIKDNKAQSYGRWLKEYVYNIIILSVHALLYTMFARLAYQIGGESFKGIFIAIVMIMFLLKAESIFKQIFGIKSGNITDIIKKSVGVAYGAKIAKSVVGANTRVLGVVTSPVTKPISKIHKRANELRRDAKILKLKDDIDRAKAAGQTSVNVGRTSSWTDPSSFILEGNQNMSFSEIADMDSTKIANSLFKQKEAIDKADRKEFKNKLSIAGNTAAGIAYSSLAIPMIAVEGAGGLPAAFTASKHFKKGINSYAKQSKNYRAPQGLAEKMRDAVLNFGTLGAYDRIRGIDRLNKDYEETRGNKVYNAQFEILKKKLDKDARKEYRKLFEDSSIDIDELKTIYAQAKTHISSDIIQNIMFEVDANRTTDVTMAINQIANGTTNIDDIGTMLGKTMKTDRRNYEYSKTKFQREFMDNLRNSVATSRGITASSVTKQDMRQAFRTMSASQREALINRALDRSSNIHEIDHIISGTSDVRNMEIQIGAAMKKQDKNIEFDKDKFDEYIKTELRKQIAQRRNIRPSEVREADVVSEYAGLSDSRKKELIKGALDSSTKLTEKRMEIDKWRKKDKVEQTGMNLADANAIIDRIGTETGRINAVNFKDNFKQIMAGQMAELQRPSVAAGITQADIANEKATYQARWGRPITDEFAKERLVNRKVFDISRIIANNTNTQPMDKYISSITHDQLIKSIKEASTINSSVIDDNLRVKPEYQRLIGIIQESKDVERKMKGKK